MPSSVFKFDRFEFHARSGELIADGRRVRLEPQPAKVLALLVGRSGEVVTREELQREVWPAEVFVDFERGLAYCVRRIRGALGDSAAAPRFVETLPKRGYRFLPAVERLPEVEPVGLEAPRAMAASTTVIAAAPSFHGRRLWRWVAGMAMVGVLAGIGVAVFRHRAATPTLPASPVSPGSTASTALAVHAVPTVAITQFDNETGRPELDRVAQVLDDTLVERMAREPGRWSVIGNAPILRQPRPMRNLAAIGSSLHADFIVLGQILPAERGVTVLTHLIRARDLRHVWAARFPAPPELPAGFAERMAASVAAAAAERAVVGN